MSDPEHSDPAPDARDPADGLLLEFLASEQRSRRDGLDRLRTSDPNHGPRAAALLHVLDEFGFLDEPDDGPPTPLRQLGEFRILAVLGTGGMGTVYLADQPRLDRRVALKVLLGPMAGAATARERFRREALAASRLEHPHICTIHQVGDDDGVPWIAMRLVPGRTLAVAIASSRDSGADTLRLPGCPSDDRSAGVAAILRFVELAARALHAAHEHGLVHRDIKPGNLMVTPTGEPVLLDFGLARMEAGDAHDLTLSGDQLGTPLYMAPEQIAGRPANRASDVYALGVVLYECLYLQRPFDAVNRESLFRQVLQDEPVLPRRRGTPFDRDLGTVLRTALAKRGEQRYATAQALAEDLRRVRGHEPILAQKPGPLLRARRFAQRHPAVVTLLAALCAALVLVALLLLQKRDALVRAQDLEAAFHVRDLAQADPMRALAQALDLHARTPDPSTLSVLYDATASATEERHWTRHEATTWRAVFASDGHRIASCSDDGLACIWNTADPAATPHELHHGGNVIDIDTDGARLVTAAFDGEARLWDFDGCLLESAPLPARSDLALRLMRARFSRDGARVVIGSADGLCWIWDLRSRAVTELRGHRGMIFHCEFSPADDLLLTLVGYGHQIREYSSDHDARLWQRDGSSIPLTGHRASLLCGAFAPDGRHVLTGSRDRSVRLWQTTGECVREFGGFRAPVACVRFHPDGELFAAADLDGAVRVFRRDGGLHAAFAHDGGVWSLQFARDGARLLTASWDKTARLHDLDGRLLRTFRGHGDRLTCAVFAPDEGRIATTSNDHTVRLWRTDDPEFGVHYRHRGNTSVPLFAADGSLWIGTDVGTVHCADPGARELGAPPRTAAVNRLVFSPDGRTIAAAHVDHSFTVWSGDTAAPVHFAWPGRRGPIGLPAWRNATLAFLDDHRFLAGAQDGTLAVFTIAGVKEHELGPAEGGDHGYEITDLCVHPGRQLFATGHWDGSVAIRRIDGGIVHTVEPERAHQSWVTAVEFSPEGSALLTASGDATAVLWQWNGIELCNRTTMLHPAAVASAHFAPDGQSILTTARDGRARFWGADGRELFSIHTGPRALTAGVWSPDGARIATADAQGIVRTWPARIERVRELARERSGR